MTHSSIAPPTIAIANWTTVLPKVAAEAEFFEIVNDFGDPLELLREAIANAIDAKATRCDIKFVVAEVDGARRLVIEITDDGHGMTRDALEQDFWGLGYSRSRGRTDTIGEKGHGTKIYLRSQKVEVHTQSAEGAFESYCDNPLAALSRRELHSPEIRPAEMRREGTGTQIRIIGYNDNERSRFIQDVVRDYILWFTKIGSVEQIFGITTLSNFKITLQCLDAGEAETIDFGHVFPSEDHNIEKLFRELDAKAADHYVKRFIRKNERLPNHPEITYDIVVSVEGDEAKRISNRMIRERRRSDTGKYRVADRYGLWLCKDYIPIERVNDWISAFGSGSNAFVLLHAFVNCQNLKLTANRKSIANSDARVLEDLRSAVVAFVSDVDEFLQRQELYTLRTWQDQERTNQQERAEFDRRVKSLRTRRIASLDGQQLLQPTNESELFGLFLTLASKKPELFPFEPLDYNTNRGIDVIARNRSSSPIVEGEHWYVELKFLLQTQFNHSFKHLRYIVCWEFDSRITQGTEFRDIGDETRRLVVNSDSDGTPTYYLDGTNTRVKIQILKLREFIGHRLGIAFEPAHSGHV